ncbi:hypothetical protein [Nocardioides mangrovi]|uniref:Uncharacterized protein n=1 Tax=Nocardioides mangrovi TaxID=2874580 RepID=A0ABS7U715_9ACTN|nr:hypothetical protein [Nocardioides mangrovi]MBZ5736766.1 hypothetical protein [Nocardioides mangrovi]
MKLLGALADWAKDTTHGIDAHIATGATECTLCPICRTVHAVRELSPEVKAQLATAATSLLNAAAGLLAAAVPDQGARSGVEHIDLDDDATEWPEEPEEDR